MRSTILHALFRRQFDHAETFEFGKLQEKLGAAFFHDVGRMFARNLECGFAGNQRYRRKRPQNIAALALWTLPSAALKMRS